MEGGENVDKEQIKSLVAGLGIAGLVAGISIAAPAQAAQSG
jgi:radical SAM modification target selenobiotic family peptide